MSLKTWILGTTLVSAVALPLSLPLSPAFAAGEKVAVNFVSLTIPFYVFMRQEAEDEAKKLGINLIIQDAQFSAPKQGSDLENALTQGVDGIIVAPTDVRSAAPAIDVVLEEGIPLIAVDRRVEGTSKPVPYVAADNVAGGRLMGEWVTKNMPKGAKIVIINGQLGSSSGMDRVPGHPRGPEGWGRHVQGGGRAASRLGPGQSPVRGPEYPDLADGQPA